MQKDYGNADTPERMKETIEHACQLLETGTIRDSFRLPGWVQAALLGAGLLTAPACQKKEEKIIPPEGIETVLKRPDEPERANNAEPVDPAVADEEPLPPGTPPPRGADPREGPLGSIHEKRNDSVKAQLAKPSGPMEPSGPTEPSVPMEPSMPMTTSGLQNLDISPAAPGPVDRGPVITYGAPPVISITSDSLPSVLIGKVKVLSGSVNPNDLQASLRRNLTQVNQCLRTGTEDRTNLSGVLELTFRINLEGKAENCEIKRHPNDPQLAQCLCQRLVQWRFPTPGAEGARVQVSWTLKSRVITKPDF